MTGAVRLVVVVGISKGGANKKCSNYSLHTQRMLILLLYKNNKCKRIDTLKQQAIHMIVDKHVGTRGYQAIEKWCLLFRVCFHPRGIVLKLGVIVAEQTDSLIRTVITAIILISTKLSRMANRGIQIFLFLFSKCWFHKVRSCMLKVWWEIRCNCFEAYFNINPALKYI